MGVLGLCYGSRILGAGRGWFRVHGEEGFCKFLVLGGNKFSNFLNVF